MRFVGDFFSKILHVLRREAQYAEYVSQNIRLVDCDDLHDRKAIAHLATGFLKLLFPDAPGRMWLAVHLASTPDSDII